MSIGNFSLEVLCWTFILFRLCKRAEEFRRFLTLFVESTHCIFAANSVLLLNHLIKATYLHTPFWPTPRQQRATRRSVNQHWQHWREQYGVDGDDD